MTVLSSQSIRELRPVDPFVERTVHPECGFSFGLGPNTYDVRLRKTIWLIPFFRSHALASTLEYFNLSGKVCGEVKDKSSWARRFLFVQNTEIDAGFRGGLTLELTYEGWLPLRIKAGWPIAQIKFQWLDQTTIAPYRGKYSQQSMEPQKVIFEK